MSAAKAATSRGITRETLLSAAAELFADNGYRATTLDDLAAALNIKKASLYHYIDSKEELLTEIYEQIFTRIRKMAEPIAASDLPVDERLRRMVFGHVMLVGNERDMLAVVFREEAELAAQAQSRIRRRKREYERIFERVVEEGQGAGVLRAGSARLIVRGLLGMCNWLYQWYEPSRYDLDEIAAEFTGLLERGWLASDGEPTRPRFTSVDEALTPAVDAVAHLTGAVAHLEEQLERTRKRLEDGLAGGA